VKNIPRDIRRGMRAYGNTLDLNNIGRPEDFLEFLYSRAIDARKIRSTNPQVCLTRFWSC
jgi:hypothetical protein